MAKPKTLKVFRTPIGFHDAYVAAPSQKAALEAWGAGTNLFTAGTAELVTDPKLTKEALAKPGEVVRLPRGSSKEHVAALGKVGRGKAKVLRSRAASGSKKRPSRAALDKAEAAIAKLDARQSEERGALDREERALAERRRNLQAKHDQALERLTTQRDEVDARYREALAKWEG
jgi:hypothetical protein